MKIETIERVTQYRLPTGGHNGLPEPERTVALTLGLNSHSTLCNLHTREVAIMKNYNEHTWIRA